MSARLFTILVLTAMVGIAVAPAPAGAGDVQTDVDTRALDRVREVPLGLPPVPVPENNPITREKIALGRRLFFDRRLSFNNTMSCGMCHIPEQGFTNNELATPVGVEGRSLRRSSPTILNSAYVEHIFHDGRDTSLETQAINPILARDEMASPSMGYVIRKIEGLDDYEGLFEAAYGGGPTVDRIIMAIASWERTLLAGNSPFDRYRYGGDADALTDQQKRGLELFTGKAACVSCHPIGTDFALFTDNGFHDTGIGYRDDRTRDSNDPVPVEISPGVVVQVDRELIRSFEEPRPTDLGRFEVTLRPEDKWRFKTPSLRNVGLTAPYMHDGSLRTLEDVVHFYNRGGIPHEGIDPLIRPIGLDDDEVLALVAFLRALTTPDVETLIADARSVPVGN